MQKNGDRASDKQRRLPPSGLCDYAAQTISERLHKMQDQADDVRRNAEVEPVHKMRVASRRARGALELFDLCFPGGDYARLEDDIKQVTTVLSEARDLDVMQERLIGHLRELPQNRRAGLQGLIDQLHANRDEAQKAVERTVRRLQDHDPETRFRTIAARNDHDRAIKGAARKGNDHG